MITLKKIGVQLNKTDLAFENEGVLIRLLFKKET